MCTHRKYITRLNMSSEYGYAGAYDVDTNNTNNTEGLHHEVCARPGCVRDLYIDVTDEEPRQYYFCTACDGIDDSDGTVEADDHIPLHTTICTRKSCVREIFTDDIQQAAAKCYACSHMRVRFPATHSMHSTRHYDADDTTRILFSLADDCDNRCVSVDNEDRVGLVMADELWAYLLHQCHMSVNDGHTAVGRTPALATTCTRLYSIYACSIYDHKTYPRRVPPRKNSVQIAPGVDTRRICFRYKLKRSHMKWQKLANVITDGENNITDVDDLYDALVTYGYDWEAFFAYVSDMVERECDVHDWECDIQDGACDIHHGEGDIHDVNCDIHTMEDGIKHVHLTRRERAKLRADIRHELYAQASTYNLINTLSIL